MTEVAVHQDREPAVFAPTPPEAIHAALEQWVGGMAASVRGAEYIVDTPMCPDSFWPLPAGVTSCKAPKQIIGNEDRDSYLARRQVATYTLGAVVRYGLQLGLPPEVAVQGIFTIGGRMSMYAEQMVALVKSQGHGHRVIERTRQRCIVEVCRRGTQDWHRFEFAIEDAIAAGYVPDQGPNAGDHGKWPDGKAKKSPGNAKYVTDPASMLYARASSIACKTEFPDVLRGLVTYEEVQDDARTTPVEVTVEPAPRVTAASILAGSGSTGQPGAEAAAQVIAEAAAPTEAPPEPEVTRAVLPASATMLEVIRALFEVHGIAGRSNQAKADRLAVFSAALDREITAPPALTDDEARMVRDNLMGESGKRLVAEALGREYPAADDQDPTTDPGWGMDGAEAEGEAAR